MLRGKDIQAIAGREKVRDTQIEKDYVITWLLWGIARHHLLKTGMVFKGGTVLKKAYFENYRFSEDLDFTLISELTDEQIRTAFIQSLEWIEEESAIQFKMSEFERHQSGSIAFYIFFVASLGGRMDSKSVKIDITRGEKLLFQPIERLIFKSYIDLENDDFSLFCYPLEEVMVEKLVALMGRTQIGRAHV